MDKLNKSTPYGSLKITKEAIAKIVGDEVTSTYGVAGIVSISTKDKGKLLDIDNFKNGLIIKKERSSYVIDIHIAVIFPLKITEIINEVQKRVKYALSKKLKITFKNINIYVDGLLIDQNN